MQKNEMMNLIRKAKDRDPDAFTTLMQQKELTDKGAAVVSKEQKNYSKLAVTDNGITITPETIIVDENFAHIAFSVKGYDLAEGDEPGFDDWNIGVKDGKEGSSVQAYGGFYDGTVSTASNIKVAKGIENTPFTVDDVELSPISIRVNYSVNGKVTIHKDSNQVPQFYGVVFKDGRKFAFLGDAGSSGYNDDMTSAYALSSFVQVIEPDQVQSILLRTDDGTEIELPLS